MKIGLMMGLGLLAVASYGCAADDSGPAGSDGDSASTGNPSTTSADSMATTGDASTGMSSMPTGGSGSSTSGDGETFAAAEGSVEDGPCFDECTSQLDILIPGGIEMFTMTLAMEDIAVEGTVECPSGVVTGWLSSRPDEVACGEASVRIIATDFAFSETLVITIDDGRPVSVMPRYTDTSSCVACNEAVVDLSGS